nr:muscle M-line assembly protein unc-89 [Onthophagus taurus]
MDVNEEADASLSNTNEEIGNINQHVEAFSEESLYESNEEVRPPDLLPENVVVVEEAVATTMESLIVNDNVVYCVSNNNQNTESLQIHTECVTDGAVTYVTVAETANRESIVTGFVETVSCEKSGALDGGEMLSGFDNIPQDTLIVPDSSNYELPTQSYEKFVQDAIAGEIEEPAMESHETIKQEHLDSQSNSQSDNIEMRLQKLTEEQENEDYDKDENVEKTPELCNEQESDNQDVNDQHEEMEEHVIGENVSADEESETPTSESIVITTGNSAHDDNIEKQLSKIVHDEEPHQLSIAEEISRDFDDSDMEELSLTHEDQESHDNVIEEVVNIAKQLGHGPVTVTDNTGQVYYVESVEEVIVVENDGKLIDSKDCKEAASKPPPSIPSHLLGRNINNPIEDTFRNGKTPPRPRLGVKIPYKNLTSQIVSKDEITREVLQRSKSRMMHNRSSREAYFAKQLTRRLAKKITPGSKKDDQKITTPEKAKGINNTDLIAILEGKDEEKHQSEAMKDEENYVCAMDRKLERELALKQLSELPRRGRRRKNSGYDVIENVNIPPRVRKTELKQDKEQVNQDHPKEVLIQINKEDNVNEDVTMNNEINLQEQLTSSEKENEKEIEEEIVAEINEEPSPAIEKPTTRSNTQKIKIERSAESTTEEEEEQESPTKKTQKNLNINEKKCNNQPIKTYERKRKSTDENLTVAVPEKKSSRIIKKKIIWDPDDPTTSKFASEKISPQKVIPIKGTTTTVKVIVKERRKSEPQPISTLISPTKSPIKRDKTPSKIEKEPIKIEKISQKPDVSNKNKKRLTEVDKLLMDEGAVNLLYSVKNEDGAKRFTGSTISLDKIQQDLRNKTKEIKKDLSNSTDKVSPKSLRKKDTSLSTPTKKPVTPASISRKRSKDSNRSSIHSPPASPSPMIYVNHADASRIIRRHSSSSYSSNEEGDANSNELKEKKMAKKKLKRDHPAQKDHNKQEDKDLNVKNKTDATSEIDKSKNINEEIFEKFSEDNKINKYNFDYSKFNRYKAINVGQLDNLVQVCLLCNGDKEKVYLTYEVLVELTDLLKELEVDETCKLVVISSMASSFCHGINYKNLHIENEQTRKEVAQKLAKAVTNYLRVLADFPKIIVAGVQGECLGLAVTMLPLFDMVLASDSATFSIPNAKLGCAAEGGSLLSLPHLMHNALVSEMLYASKKFVAAEVLRFGMVTRVIWPEKFQKELITAVIEISTNSLQFKQITKRQLRNRMKNQIQESLAGEEDILLETWISAECQKNFENYV